MNQRQRELAKKVLIAAIKAVIQYLVGLNVRSFASSYKRKDPRNANPPEHETSNEVST